MSDNTSKELSGSKYGKPLTLQELNEEVKKRTDLISKEFRDGVEMIQDYPRSVTFFGSARFDENHQCYKMAVTIAERIVEELGYAVVTGGGPGIMEAGNRGAHNKGGDSIGFTIALPHEQNTNPYVTDAVDFYYFFTRKVSLTFAAEAYFYFPGGFGTMDELFEILTLVQTKKIEKVPIILVGVEFWSGLFTFIKDTLLENGTISEEDLSLFTITDDVDQMIKIVSKAEPRIIDKFAG